MFHTEGRCCIQNSANTNITGTQYHICFNILVAVGGIRGSMLAVLQV